MSISIPLAAVFPQGQDTPFLLVFAGASVFLTRQGRDFLAGLVLALCAVKFHLFLLVPVVLVLKKRWRILAGAATGSVALFLFGIVVAGTGSTEQYVGVLLNPYINFSPDMMPNLHGLAAGVAANAPATLELGLALAVILAFLWICQKSDHYEFLFALALLCNLLVSFHSGVSDQLLLLLVFVLMVRSGADKPLRIALAVTLTPLPYFTGLGVNIVVPVMLLGVLMLAGLSAGRRSAAVAG